MEEIAYMETSSFDYDPMHCIGTRQRHSAPHRIAAKPGCTKAARRDGFM